MKIDVKVNKFDGEKGLKGFATITLGEILKIPDFSIWEGQDGLYVNYPSKKVKKYKDYQGNEKEWRDTCYCITKEKREELFKKILDEFGSIGNSYPEEQGFYPINEDIDSRLPF